MGTVEVFDFFSPSNGQEWDWISEAGDWVVCVLWIGGSMGLLAWAKVWVGNPSFNSGKILLEGLGQRKRKLTEGGCSMAAVTLYTVVIKEGAFPKLLEVLLIVLIGGMLHLLIKSVSHAVQRQYPTPSVSQSFPHPLLHV